MRILNGLAIRLANKLAPKPAPVVRTTDSLLVDISEKVALLHIHADSKVDESMALSERAAELITEANVAAGEAARAQRVADKLEELLA